MTTAIRKPEVSSARLRIRNRYKIESLPEDRMKKLLYKLHWELERREKDTETGKWAEWWTSCGRYRVVRTLREFEPEASAFVAMLGKTEIIGEFRSLVRAFEACRVKHVDTFQLIDDDVSDNARQVCREAEELGLDTLPVKKEQPQEDTVPKPKKKDGKQKTASGNPRYTLFGKSVTSVLRWMGKQGWDKETAARVLKAEGITVDDQTVRSQVNGWDYRGEPAELSKDEEKKLKAHLIGQSKSKKK
jgi:hypothetical protein